MRSYVAPVRDTLYVLDAVIALPALSGHPAFRGVNRDMVESILGAGGKFVAEVIAPLHRIGDRGCTRHADGSVTAPPGYKEAYAAFCAAGWPSLLGPTQYGGQGLPHIVWLAFEEFVLGANMTFSPYLSLTQGVIAALLSYGTDEMRQLYLPRLISGEWSGTMNLTEPQCGTDLGLIRTRADRTPDGNFVISGTKIFITSGEHDLSSNIVHLVLARIQGAPAGVRGLTLFLVPKILPQHDGSLGARNGVSCVSIEHKMGLNGSATCTMSYDGATGFLVGEEGKGVAAMFVMMNLARLHVAVQGLGAADAAYQHALGYARERRQGRASKGARQPDQPADLLLVHPDVRRMLMECKAQIEGCRALCLWAALQADVARSAAAPQEREVANELLGLLTPVVKAHVTDMGYRCTTLAQQVFGGHGYIRETGVEQFVRDVRIAMIYEGTNGVQAMDLAGRKIVQNGGRGMRHLSALLADQVRDAVSSDYPQLQQMGCALQQAAEELQRATSWLTERNQTDPDDVGAGAWSYLQLFATVCVGSMWLKMASWSRAHMQDSTQDAAFHEAKLGTAQFYFDRLLPDAYALRLKIESGARSTMQLADDQF